MQTRDRTHRKNPSCHLFARPKRKVKWRTWKKLLHKITLSQRHMLASSRSNSMLSSRSTLLPTMKKLVATAAVTAEKRALAVGPREKKTRMEWTSTLETMMILRSRLKNSAVNTSRNSLGKLSTITIPWNSTRARSTWISISKLSRRSNSKRNLQCTLRSTMRTS